ncbi:dna ligase 3 [Lasius niger]|uniref:Dna ligase 3 n=1 Tax=Lasius niger TaxID=67767 RepID=A0A0J7KJN7_LASNI|nr:dna ligase 3 [Lasius niger]
MSSDVEEEEQQGEEKPFAVERAKTGRAKCKRCKCTIEKGEMRIGKYVTSFFADGKLMPAWHHVACLFEAFAKQRATTKRIDDPAENVKGWEQLSDDDRKIILDKLEEFEKSCRYHALDSLLVEEISLTFFTPLLVDLFASTRGSTFSRSRLVRLDLLD